MTTRYISLFRHFCIVAVTLLCGAAFGQSIIPVEAWTVDQASAQTKSKSIYLTRGESRYIQPSITYEGPWVFPSNAAVVMRYRSSGMTNTYYTATGSVFNATGGVLRVTWTPANEASASAYSFEIEAATGTTAAISVSGSIFLRNSLMTLSSLTNPAYTSYFDWNYITSVNATNGPWIAFVGLDSVARTAASNAQSSANNALAGILNSSNRIEVVNGIATNALTIGTNALAIAQAIQAQSPIAAPAATNIAIAVISSWAPTGSVYHATTAGSIAGSNANYSWEMVGGLLTVYEVTNTAVAVVSQSDGAGYNGPANGFTLLYTGYDGNGKYEFAPDGGWYAWSPYAKATDALLFINTVDAKQWYSQGGIGRTLQADAGGAVGSFMFSWITATNTYTIGIDATARAAASNAQATADSATNWISTNTLSARIDTKLATNGSGASLTGVWHTNDAVPFNIFTNSASPYTNPVVATAFAFQQGVGLKRTWTVETNGTEVIAITQAGFDTNYIDITTNGGIAVNAPMSLNVQGDNGNNVPDKNWVRSLMVSGEAIYQTTNKTLGFPAIPPTNYTYLGSSVIPALDGSVSVPTVSNNHYAITMISTNMLLAGTEIRGPASVECYLTRTDNGTADALSVKPEIYYFYTNAPSVLLGDFSAAAQSIVATTTNKYNWTIAYNDVTMISNAYIFVRMKVTSVNNSTTLIMGLGPTYPSRVSFPTPDTSSIGTRGATNIVNFGGTATGTYNDVTRTLMMPPTLTNEVGSSIERFWAGPATNQAYTNANTVYFTW